MRQINLIADATDSSGVPSWGQVQNLVAGGSGSYWALNGSDIFYNTGNVGIGTNAPAQALDVSGESIFRGDMGMDTHQITNIMDATDSSGVPSWGQVQNLVAGGSGSYWALNGSDIFYNTGNVGIGTNAPAQALDVSGESIFRGDMDMDTHQITNIMDATDPSGVPSLGQVHNLIDASSHWILNGNNITNDNAGQVIINQSLFVANDICSNQVLTYTNGRSCSLNLINRFNSLLGATRPPLSPLDTRLVASERYDSSQYPCGADPIAKLVVGTTIFGSNSYLPCVCTAI